MRYAPAMRLLALSAVVAGLAYLVGLPAPLSLAAKAWPALAMAAMLAPRRTPFARTIALGLVLSAIGDVVLDLPDAFLLGLVAFLCAHGGRAIPGSGGAATCGDEDERRKSGEESNVHGRRYR